jgi:diguanylate cyclase (GGDEF)-like protein
MPRQTARAFVKRWIARKEALPFVPALLLAGVWFGGEMVLVLAAVLFPALYVLGRDEPGGVRRGEDDGLTGLALGSDLVEALDGVFVEAARTGRSTVAFAIEVDAFDRIETQHGLHAAEVVLKRVAERIAGVVREKDTVARLEGAVFGIGLAPGGRCDLEAAIQTAARIQAAVREPVALDQGQVHASCSVGFCLGSRAPQPSGEAILGAARAALSEAVLAGPGSIRAYAGPRTAQPSRTDAREAAAALEAGHIRPWFQPQLSTDTGQISGFEALARWEHPDLGVIEPQEFLPALATAGVLDRLGDQMLFHSLNALRAWDKAGVKVPTVGLNMSAEELRNPRLAERLAWELDRFGLAPERLTVEVLEAVVVDMSDDTIPRTIAALRKLGCRIDLDDFGTANASLAALRRFDIGRIKIDRSFVAKIDTDREQQRMVSAILSMAERLGIETLAEGVERVSEHAMLAQLGCNHVQGFGIARAMPFEETIGWMGRYSSKLAAAPEIRRRVG